MVRRLVDAYHPERVYLFGSVARGDAGPDSDYDLMVVVPDDAPAHLLNSRTATAPSAILVFPVTCSSIRPATFESSFI